MLIIKKHGVCQPRLVTKSIRKIQCANVTFLRSLLRSGVLPHSVVFTNCTGFNLNASEISLLLPDPSAFAFRLKPVHSIQSHGQSFRFSEVNERGVPSFRTNIWVTQFASIFD
jgi:hypothetical protein